MTVGWWTLREWQPLDGKEHTPVAGIPRMSAVETFEQVVFQSQLVGHRIQNDWCFAFENPVDGV